MLLEPHEEPEDTPRPGTRGKTFRRLLPFLRPHLGSLLTGAALMTLRILCILAGPAILAWVIDTALASEDRNLVLYGVAAYFLAFVAGTAVGYLQIMVLSRMGLRIVTAIKEEIFGHLLRLSTLFHDKNPVGKLISRTESDAESIKELFSRNGIEVIASAFQFVLTLGVMLVLNLKVAIVFLVLVPALSVATFVFLKIIRRIYRRVRKRYAELAGTITEYVQGVPVVQQFNQKERALRILDERNQAKYRDELKAWVLDYSFWGGFFYFEVLATAAIVWFGTGAIIDGKMTVGVLVLFMEFTRRVFEPIIRLGEQLNQIQRGLAAADRVFDLLDTPPDVADRQDAQTSLTFTKGIRFEDVSFSYDGEKMALDGVSFDVRRGEKVALVGPSGGGKTTLVGLLFRFMDPTKGRVTVDGRDIRDFTLEAWRSRLGLVLQEIYLFPGSVLDNLRVLDDSIGEEDVAEAARAVQADDFIRRLPRGYGEDLAERGGNLSLGERQLLSFARALTLNPDVLVLDEATSSVDPETEGRIQAALDRLLEGRTAVIVAHRLSTIRNADRILVIQGGEVAEEGSHEELYAKGGRYRELYELQAEAKGNGGRP